MDREPWLIPLEAVQEAENCHFMNGRALKRKGFERFATGTGGSGVNVLAAPPVMGLFNYMSTGGSAALVALDTDFLYVYNPTNDDWEPKGGHPITPDWTGDDDHFFYGVVVAKGKLGAGTDLLFLTNDNDNIKYWDGTNITAMAPGAGAALNRPETCTILIQHKNRLIALNTQESGARHPQRARCSNVGTYDNWTGDIYTDAETSEWITGAGIIRGELVVFFEKSTWWLRYTGDPLAPFGWEQISPEEGNLSPYAVQTAGGQLLGMGAVSMVGSNGITAENISPQIPELVFQMNLLLMNYCHSVLAKDTYQYLCNYVGKGASLPDKMIAYNYRDKSFSLYTVDSHVFATWTHGSDWTFDDITVDMDEMSWAFDDRTLTAGYPIVLMGDTSGYVNRFLVTDADNGSAITSRLKTKRLAPYKAHKSKLGYVDIIGDAGPMSLTVKMYKDYQPNPYLNRTISMQNAAQDKVRVRVRVMEKGETHSIEISDSATGNAWVIDAIIPYFRAAGAM